MTLKISSNHVHIVRPVDYKLKNEKSAVYRNNGTRAIITYLLFAPEPKYFWQKM